MVPSRGHHFEAVSLGGCPKSWLVQAVFWAGLRRRFPQGGWPTPSLLPDHCASLPSLWPRETLPTPKGCPLCSVPLFFSSQPGWKSWADLLWHTDTHGCSWRRLCYGVCKRRHVGPWGQALEGFLVFLSFIFLMVYLRPEFGKAK